MTGSILKRLGRACTWEMRLRCVSKPASLRLGPQEALALLLLVALVAHHTTATRRLHSQQGVTVSGTTAAAAPQLDEEEPCPTEVRGFHGSATGSTLQLGPCGCAVCWGASACS